MKYMTHLFVRTWALPERFRNRWDSENLYLICIFSELVSKLRVYTDDLGPRATQCMASSPILGPWRPDAWTRKIRFPHLVRNSFKTATCDGSLFSVTGRTELEKKQYHVQYRLKTAISIYDFTNVWSQATNGSFSSSPSIRMYTSVCIHLYVYICMYTSVCTHLYVYICMYTFVCIYLYVYICMYTFRSSGHIESFKVQGRRHAAPR